MLSASPLHPADLLRRLPWPMPALLAWSAGWLAWWAAATCAAPHAAGLLLALLASGMLAWPCQGTWRRLIAAAGFPLSAIVLGPAAGWPAWCGCSSWRHCWRSTPCAPGVTHPCSPPRPMRWRVCSSWCPFRAACWTPAVAWAMVWPPCSACGPRPGCKAWNGARCWPAWPPGVARRRTSCAVTCGHSHGRATTWSTSSSGLRAWPGPGPRPSVNCHPAPGW